MSDSSLHRRTLLGCVASASAIAIAGGSSVEDATPLSDTLEERHADASRPETAASAGPSDGVDLAVTAIDLEPCGATCRDATVELTNVGSATATNVIGTVTVVAGATHVWEGEERVDRLEAGESVRRRERIEIGVGTALAIRNNDGRVTVTTTIESDQQTTRTVDEMAI